jgi:hypothetical protein
LQHAGPVIDIAYRKPGGQWQSAFRRDLKPSDVGKVFTWHFYTGKNWDWRTSISLAKPGDSFDIGHAVEDF